MNYLSVKGRSRKRTNTRLLGRSRRQYPSISRDTYKTFIKACNKYSNTNNATIIDAYGNIIGFSTFKDITLPTFN